MEVHALHATFLAARAFFRLLRWIGYFRFTNKFVGLKVIFLPPQRSTVLGRFLTFLKVNGRSLGDQVVSIKTWFFTKKIWKTTNNARQRQTTENDIHRERKN